MSGGSFWDRGSFAHEARLPAVCTGFGSEMDMLSCSMRRVGAST
jgi:hypothetical protein